MTKNLVFFLAVTAGIGLAVFFIFNIIMLI